ncbi:hypothetical protein BDN70DRAFT_902111 [Pholiota conissans]|uniref:Uncharacterized protein n=1 Tax=Pholiota conissans TaxID=109636 RepID=A0A9P5YID9_9AGAR|nr:hypothetical protein BDN70DRAFT_902111 [Pholiota conissans]
MSYESDDDNRFDARIASDKYHNIYSYSHNMSIQCVLARNVPGGNQYSSAFRTTSKSVETFVDESLMPPAVMLVRNRPAMSIHRDPMAIPNPFVPPPPMSGPNPFAPMPNTAPPTMANSNPFAVGTTSTPFTAENIAAQSNPVQPYVFGPASAKAAALKKAALQASSGRDTESHAITVSSVASSSTAPAEGGAETRTNNEVYDQHGRLLDQAAMDFLMEERRALRSSSGSSISSFEGHRLL